MPQGSLKASAKPKSAAPARPLKKGNRAFKPKRTAARKDAQIVKRHTAALTGATEKLLAARVGHLELLKGTRRELEATEKAKNRGDKAKKRT